MRILAIKLFSSQCRMISHWLATDDPDQVWPDNTSRWYDGDGALDLQNIQKFKSDPISDELRQVAPPPEIYTILDWMVSTDDNIPIDIVNPLLEKITPSLQMGYPAEDDAKVGTMDFLPVKQTMSFTGMCEMNHNNDSPDFSLTVGFVGGGGDAMAAIMNGGKVIAFWEVDSRFHAVIEELTGVTPHGDLYEIDLDRLPFSDGFTGGADCRDFSPMGSEIPDPLCPS